MTTFTHARHLLLLQQRLTLLEKRMTDAENILNQCEKEMNPVYSHYSPEHVDGILCDIRRARNEHARVQDTMKTLRAEREHLQTAITTLDSRHQQAQQQREKRVSHKNSKKNRVKYREASRESAVLARTVVDA